MNKFKLPIGDWSEDGHNQCDYFIVNSNVPFKEIVTAYMAMDEEYKLSDQCSEYENYKLTKHTEFLMYPHNIFLNWWVELGILGLVGLFSIVGLYIKKTTSLLSTNKKTVIALLGVLVAIIIYGIVDVIYFKNDLAVLFWLFLGLTVVIKPQK